MRRSDRLFQIIQTLRSARAPVTAQALADEFETSKRTIYRDIADLMAQRVPIRGEAGVGYVLEQGYDMPPLMLTADEIEAAVLGAGWVAARGDPALRRGARDLIAKIGEAVPPHLRPIVLDPAVFAPPPPSIETDALDVERLRAAIRSSKKLRIDYVDELECMTRRVIWPISVAYFETVRLVAAWCELRQGFRNFRTDRITAVEFLQERFPVQPEKLRAAWWIEEKQRRPQMPPAQRYLVRE